MRRRFRRSYVCLLSVLAALVLGTAAPAARGEPVVIAYNANWPPYSHGEHDQVDGILVRLVAGIVRDGMGAEVRSIGLPWARAQREVARGMADALVTFPSAARLGYAHASQEVVLSLDTKAYVRPGSDAEVAIRAEPTINVHRRFQHCVLLADGWTNDFLGRHAIPFSTGRETAGCLRLVAAGRQDVFLHVAEATEAAIQSLNIAGQVVALPKVYASVPLNFLLSKASKVPAAFVGRFDAALRAMKADGRFEALRQRR